MSDVERMNNWEGQIETVRNSEENKKGGNRY